MRSRRQRHSDPWSIRTINHVKESTLLSVLFLAAAVLSAGIVITNSGAALYDRWNRQFDWRDDEYAKLRSLAAGFSREIFRERLGPPVFDRWSANSRLREETYRGRDHWVQTVSNRTGTVVVYTVTACDPDFKPRFSLPGGGTDHAVRVNETTFDAVGGAPVADYFIGQTANTRFIEWFGVGNPSHYQTAIWGINDACPDWLQQLKPLQEEGAYPPLLRYRGRPAMNSPSWLKRFRQRAVINTWGETAPDFYVPDLRDGFQLGVDRILVRTVNDNN